MKLMKTYKYKLKPTKKQEETFESWVNTCRFIYNLALEERITHYEMRKKSPSKFDQYNQLSELKKYFPFLKRTYSSTLEDSLDRLDKTYLRFFKGSGFPKFAKKGQYNSFTYKRHFTVKDKTIKLPKIGEVKYFNSREIIGKPKTATIVKQVDGWFICITAEYETDFETIEIDKQNPIAFDMGATRFLALSDGSFIDSPLFLEPNLKKLKVLQRKLARQRKGSKSREITKIQIQKLFKNISNQRLDFLHKTSTNLSEIYSSIYMEDLKLQKMQESGFTKVNRNMSDRGFAMFKELLKYKMVEKGKHLGLVNPAYTSQKCSECLITDKKSRLSQSEFVCTSCGHLSNADLNASKNILRQGLSQKAKSKTLV